MNERIAELRWTDDQWNRIQSTVSEEARRTRVATKFLPIYGPIDSDQVAVPDISLGMGPAPLAPAAAGIAPQRLEINSRPDTVLTTISALVYVRNHEAADPELQAALTMFRRAANLIARTEDALMLKGQPNASAPPPGAPAAPIQVTGGRTQWGLLGSPTSVNAANHPANRIQIAPAGPGLAALGWAVPVAVNGAIGQLEGRGYRGPYVCVFSNALFQAVHMPTPQLTLPRHIVEPMLDDGMILRSSFVDPVWGVVASYESAQIEQVLASDIAVKFLHISEEPRFIFRVSERVALRVRDWGAVVNLTP